MPLDSAFQLQALCLKLDISTFRVFELAADACCFLKSKAACDFNEYLLTGSLPRYVTLYVTKNITDDDIILWQALIGQGMLGYA